MVIASCFFFVLVGPTRSQSEVGDLGVDFSGGGAEVEANNAGWVSLAVSVGPFGVLLERSGLGGGVS